MVDIDKKVIEVEEDWAGWRVCPECRGDGQVLIDDEWTRYRLCESQGEVCDRCGAPPRYQISEDEWGGGCWCHY